MKNSVPRWKLVLVPGLLLALVGVVGWVASSWPSAKPPTFPLTPISSSPFRNTTPDVAYVGSDKCRGCHEGDTVAYRRTGMGRSMAPIDLDREPPDGAYDHPVSKRRYAVTRKDGQLWHREMRLGGDVVLQEYPVKYVVGSGRHSLTYLVEADGFLVESPITWYRSRNGWFMSPGYDVAEHGGFERSVGEGCLICHAGQAHAVEGSLHRMRVLEPTIGCERCHGPGALHLARHADDKPAQGGVDHTIVNPRHLPRDLAEAVCQQCHLRSSATIDGRGRKPTDFRPGLPLQDFRQDYLLDVPDRPMTVVGHVEQMHLSKCYQKSDTLTCMTCHNPHKEPRPAEREGYYNAVCAKCHPPAACRVDPARRAKESPQNNCIGCHMPSSPTEIPHLAFTHHRIGHHAPAGAADKPGGRGILKPVLDLSRLSDIDRKRSLGLGYLETANRERDPGSASHYRQHALDLLTNVRKAGLRDGSIDAALARLHFDLESAAATSFAASAAADQGLTAQDRCNVLFLLADAHLQRGEHKEALPLLLELTKLRRHPTDWLMLADCRKRLEGPGAEVAALEQAARINPRLVRIHQHLANHHREKGDARKAAWHQARALP
jgi:hypothetical protein